MRMTRRSALQRPPSCDNFSRSDMESGSRRKASQSNLNAADAAPALAFPSVYAASERLSHDIGTLRILAPDVRQKPSGLLRADKEESGSRQSSNSVTTGSTPQQASPLPTLVSGSLNIKSQNPTVTQLGGSIISSSLVWKIAKEFKASVRAIVNEPQGGNEVWEYGIVQNVFFDHIEEVYDDGDMLVDSVGPLVDVASASEVPFIHQGPDNPQLPSQLFNTFSVGPFFTDIPSLEVQAEKLHCKKTKQSKIVSVARSSAFRAGLVARGIKSKRLVPLGAIGSTYMSKLRVDFPGAGFEWTELITPDGTYKLSADSNPVTMDGKIANDEGQATLNAESSEFEQRCENVLS